MKISELENAPEWLKNANAKNEDVTIVDGVVQWHRGEWLGGTWYGGTWHRGEWLGGVWHGGMWHKGVWHGGMWLDGEWLGGTWHKGVWYGGEWHGGEWHGGEWHGGAWRGFSGKLLRMSNIDGSLRMITLIKHEKGVQIEAGCFFGDSSEFLKRAKDEGKNYYVQIVGAVVSELLTIKED